ncbi:kinase-like protein [Corynespora cassiicola Philippines]|uniref:Kinase-like protein n=1 Tax=Corynespora cassiicola Philippines TaxID=1448308 RepID=A0A2T2N2V4_CORCC|nr:kinase-like protein [Corynespora cassiicola Philippines]
MASTLVGQSGRVYVQGEVIQRHYKDPKLSIFKAASGDEHFALKRTTKPYFDLSQRIAVDISGSHRLRVHVDYNQDEGILIYTLFKTTPLALLQQDPDFPSEGRKTILRRVGEAIKELHDKDWIHTDVKPNNILQAKKKVTDVALGDFDIAYELKDGEARNTPYAIGNAMWRSPEGQTGRGMTKASDIFSFGLVCIYALGGGELLLIDNYQELVKEGILPEQEILTRHFSYFDQNALKGVAKLAELSVHDQPEIHFDSWGKELGSNAHDIISGMTKIDPGGRLTIGQALDHPWWEEEDDDEEEAGG